MGKLVYPTVEVKPEITALLKRMKLEMGNPTHMEVNKRYGKLVKLMQTQALSDQRMKRMANLEIKKTAREKEISQTETYLIGALKMEVERQEKLSTNPQVFPQHDSKEATDEGGESETEELL